jgi:5'-AMP-activated protein kinase, catalytic alpha subunit
VDDTSLLSDGDVIIASSGEPFELPGHLASPGKNVIGSYRTVSYLGKGSFGKVYKGIHIANGTTAALKFINKSSVGTVSDVERVMGEIHAMKALTHPGIVGLFEVIDTDKAVVLVLEFAGGGDLRQKVEREGRLTEPEAASLFGHILEGVAYCHRNNIIHHDLKLENILICGDGKV